MKASILANLAGNAVVAAINILFVPIYLRTLGIEAWGLVGFFTTLQVALSLLDLGLGPATSRSFASGFAGAGGPEEASDFVRTLEYVYGGLALLIAVAVSLAAPYLAGHWLKADRMDVETVRNAILLMAVVVAAQWPTSLYRGALQGLDRQISLNAILAGVSLVRAVVTVLVLLMVSSTILAFLVCQLVAATLQTVLLRLSLWRNLPRTRRPARVRIAALDGIRRFAGGMTAIAALSLVLMQLDKIVVSRLLPLAEVGYYTLASMIAGALALISGAVFYAIFPEFSRAASAGEANLAALYHRGSQAMAVLVLPMAAVVILFPREVLFVWTGDAVTAGHTAATAAILTAGSALNGLMNPPYALQLAHGWTSLVVRVNLVAIAFVVPLLIGFTLRFGLEGAASVGLLLNAGYVVIQVPLIHRRLLRGEMRSWYTVDVAGPAFVALGVAAFARWVPGVHVPAGRPGLLLWLGVVFVIAQSGAILAAPAMRAMLSTALGRLRGR